MTRMVDGVDGLGYDSQDRLQFLPGYRLRFGQAGGAAQFNTANQGIGTVALPAIAAGATGEVTINDSTIDSTSMVFCQVTRNKSAGFTVPAAGAIAGLVADVKAISTSQPNITIELRNVGSAATLATDYELWYWIVGPA